MNANHTVLDFQIPHLVSVQKYLTYRFFLLRMYNFTKRCKVIQQDTVYHSALIQFLPLLLFRLIYLVSILHSLQPWKQGEQWK